MSASQPDVRYELVADWAQWPPGKSCAEVTDLKVDSLDYLHVLGRKPHAIYVFDPEGVFIRSWGERLFIKPHGLFIDPEDNLYVVDTGAHAVYKFDTHGNKLLTLGTPGAPSDTGLVPDRSPVSHGGPPFHFPTHLIVLDSGEIWVTDGYGNARVHRFAADGSLLESWGGPGAAGGEFNLPHGLARDSANRLYVSDRENSRVQIFSPEGEFLEAWGFVNRPNNILIDADDRVFISECGFYTNLTFPAHFNYITEPPPGNDKAARVTVCTTEGEVLARIGEENTAAPGNILAPHGLALDSRGDLYVGETPVDGGAYRTYGSHTLPTLQKFRRLG